mgnify:CR=1 FL=1
MSLHPAAPRTLAVAFYKGTRPGVAGLYNRLGRFLDRGPYSHCELLFSDGASASSSFLDGGVRFKAIGYSSENCWDFFELTQVLRSAVALQAAESRARGWFVDHMGLPYDVWGNIRFACGFARDSADAWFCSEAVAAALGFADPFRYGPNGLHSHLQDWQWAVQDRQDREVANPR